MGKNFDVAAYKAPTNIYMNNGAKYAGECTTYCWGRAYEVMRGNPDLPNAAAGKWFKGDHGHLTGQTPKATSIGCFTTHVVFVEDYNKNTDKVRFSEANWYVDSDSKFSNGKWEPDPSGTDGEKKEVTLTEFKKRSGTGNFQGFIYLV